MYSKNDKKAMISVCIATYNGEKYIYEQLQSILCQLDEFDEVIVSDDGSTDRTIALVEALQDTRIRIIHHNKTLQISNHLFDYTTHNFENALKHVRGDIVFLSDQDDVWFPNKVQVMCESLQTNLLVLSDCKVTDSNLRVLHNSYFAMNKSRPGILRNIYRNAFLGSCMAFRRELLEIALPFPRSMVPHDIWLGLLASLKGNIFFEHRPLILYRRHDFSVSTAGYKSVLSLGMKISYRIIIVWKLYRRLLYGK